MCITLSLESNTLVPGRMLRLSTRLFLSHAIAANHSLQHSSASTLPFLLRTHRIRTTSQPPNVAASPNGNKPSSPRFGRLRMPCTTNLHAQAHPQHAETIVSLLHNVLLAPAANAPYAATRRTSILKRSRRARCMHTDLPGAVIINFAPVNLPAHPCPTPQPLPQRFRSSPI